MEIDVKHTKQRNKRRERAQRMQAERDKDADGVGVGVIADGDSADEDSKKPIRPPQRRKKANNFKEPSPILEEDVVDGFAILSFKTYEDLEVRTAVKSSSTAQLVHDECGVESSVASTRDQRDERLTESRLFRFSSPRRSEKWKKLCTNISLCRVKLDTLLLRVGGEEKREEGGRGRVEWARGMPKSLNKEFLFRKSLSDLARLEVPANLVPPHFRRPYLSLPPSSCSMPFFLVNLLCGFKCKLRERKTTNQHHLRRARDGEEKRKIKSLNRKARERKEKKVSSAEVCIFLSDFFFGCCSLVAWLCFLLLRVLFSGKALDEYLNCKCVSCPKKTSPLVFPL